MLMMREEPLKFKPQIPSWIVIKALGGLQRPLCLRTVTAKQTIHLNKSKILFQPVVMILSERTCFSVGLLLFPVLFCSSRVFVASSRSSDWLMSFTCASLLTCVFPVQVVDVLSTFSQLLCLPKVFPRVSTGV